VGLVKVVGGQSSEERQTQIDRFWRDPECRVLVGTSAVERSLNLQVSQRLVFVDLHLNPARVTQIVGRIRRGGSRFRHVYVYNLLAEDTQEDGYKDVLETRQALADYVFDDESDLFDKLEPAALLQLIGRPRRRAS
jgi:SNF2 family DNA or RNA helicase